MVKEDYLNKQCEFKAFTNNTDVEVKEVRPFFASNSLPIIIDLKTCSLGNEFNFVKIEYIPKHGKIFKINSSILVYKPNKHFNGFDEFQIRVTDYHNLYSTKTIIIYVDD